MPQDTDLRQGLDVGPWSTSLTGSFRDSQMGYFLYQTPADIAHMLTPQRDNAARTNALMEFTQRGEWRKAARVARELQSLYPFVIDEIRTIYGEDDMRKLLFRPLDELPTVVY